MEKSGSLKETRHRTDISKMQGIFYNISNQLKYLSGELDFSPTKEEKKQCRKAIEETVANIMNVLIALSEELHDFKDKELDETLKEIDSQEKKRKQPYVFSS